MKNFSHADQQRIWDEEHKNPKALLQMDQEEASGGVVKFYDFLKEKDTSNLKGLEMGCGKGRNVIWLAQKVQAMYGFDFSQIAIKEAKKRALNINVLNTHFDLQDATMPWNFKSNYFDFTIDCFASTDIESKEGRMFAIKEMERVLKPGGYLFVYLLSTDDEFHKEMVSKMPAEERNAFHHPTGKFEKTFDEKDLKELYQDFNIIKMERIEKIAKFYDKNYYCKHFWLVLQKPNVSN